MRVAVVGGGPAGATAACRLARAGIPVTLFDPSHPREKPCGGGITGRALGLAADMIDITALPAVTVQCAVTSYHGMAADVPLVDGGLSAASSLAVVSRAVFDKALLEAAVAAGARLVPDRVTDVEPDGSGFVVRTPSRSHRADFLIGADGAASIVRKKLLGAFARNDVSIAAGYFSYGAHTASIEIEAMPADRGYLWSFPRPDHLAVGICTPATGPWRAADLRRRACEWLDRRRAASGARLKPYAWPIPSIGGVRDPRASGPRWVLVGDAGGLVDPLTREGIYYALLSGAWAAEALAGGLETAAASYEQRLRTDVYPELRKAAKLCGLFFSPRFAQLFVWALGQSAGIREVFGDLVAGRQPYRGLRRRLLATGEWKLAVRACRWW